MAGVFVSHTLLLGIKMFARSLPALGISVVLVACGGGGGGDGGSSGGALASTEIISTNLAANYSAEYQSVKASIQACFRKTGISGASMHCSKDAKLTAASAFLNIAYSNISSIANNSNIDKVEIVKLMEKYKLLDLAWLNTETFSPPMTMSDSEVGALSASYNTNINTFYANAILKINSI